MGQLDGFLQPIYVKSCLFLADAAFFHSDSDGQQVQHASLHRVGFGAGYGDLRAGIGIQDNVRFPGDGGTGHIDNGERFDTLLFG